MVRLRKSSRSDTISHKDLGTQQVRIKVRSASVNPIDYMLLEALGEDFLGRSPSVGMPFGIGFDADGTVVEVGKSVKQLKVGDAVYIMTPFSGIGSLAEFLVIDEEFVAVKPANLDFNEAAAVPTVALTAYSGMASSRNNELVKSIGADQVIDYTKEKWLAVLDLHSVDVVYDCGMEASAWNDGAQMVLKKITGRFLTILPMAQPVKEAEFGAQLVGEVHNTDPSAEKLDVITKYIESGKAKPVMTRYSHLRKLWMHTRN